MKKIQASDNDLLIVTILFSLIGSLLSLPFYLSIYGISTGILTYLSGAVLTAYALYFSVITYNCIKEGGVFTFNNYFRVSFILFRLGYFCSGIIDLYI